MTSKPVLLKLENKEHCIFKQWPWSQAAGVKVLLKDSING